MKNNKETQIMYHGSSFLFNRPDLRACSKFRDFGRGLYLTWDENHAFRNAYKNRNKTGQGFMYTFEVPKSFGKYGLKTKVFRTTSLDWVDFIIGNRRTDKTTFQNNYDVIIGPTADDNASLLVSSYFSGFFGEVDTLNAKLNLTKALKAYVFPKQMRLHSEEALKAVRLIGVKRVI